jgi:hypothetical protein
MGYRARPIISFLKHITADSTRLTELVNSRTYGIDLLRVISAIVNRLSISCLASSSLCSCSKVRRARHWTGRICTRRSRIIDDRAGLADWVLVHQLHSMVAKDSLTADIDEAGYLRKRSCMPHTGPPIAVQFHESPK